MMKERLQNIKDEALKAIEAADMPEKLNDVRVKFLGKKGELTAVLKGMKDVAPEDRPKVGQMVNETRAAIEAVLEENKEKIEMLIKTFFNRLKGYHVQYNVVSKETLLDAQAHPEKHKDLIVRVAGYSAFFNVLSKATQDDIIGRTEQTL